MSLIKQLYQLVETKFYAFCYLIYMNITAKCINTHFVTFRHFHALYSSYTSKTVVQDFHFVEKAVPIII